MKELRLVLTVTDHAAALRFYRDTLGLPQVAEFPSPGGRVVLLDAGRATIELVDAVHAAHIDEVEVGRRVAGPIRIAVEVDDAAAMTARLTDEGAEVIAAPVRTPWNSLNARLAGPDGVQLTLFEELGDAGS